MGRTMKKRGNGEGTIYYMNLKEKKLKELTLFFKYG